MSGPPNLASQPPLHAQAPIRIAVVEEDEILRRGIVACLAEDQSLTVAASGPRRPTDADVDIAVVSSAAGRRERFPCPIVVYVDESDGVNRDMGGNEIAGVLTRGSLTVAQLNATVRAAASGLRVNHQNLDRTTESLDPRSRRLVMLLADGYSTREIAERMSYSERTIKKLITQLEAQLQARTRAQMVALAIRRGLI